MEGCCKGSSWSLKLQNKSKGSSEKPHNREGQLHISIKVIYDLIGTWRMKTPWHAGMLPGSHQHRGMDMVSVTGVLRPAKVQFVVYFHHDKHLPFERKAKDVFLKSN